MSLTDEQLKIAIKELKTINIKVNALFVKMNLPLKDKIQMDHYGAAYLFGKDVSTKTSDEQLIKIIKTTPEKSWNGHVDFFGKWKD